MAKKLGFLIFSLFFYLYNVFGQLQLVQPNFAEAFWNVSTSPNVEVHPLKNLNSNYFRLTFLTLEQDQVSSGTQFNTLQTLDLSTVPFSVTTTENQGIIGTANLPSNMNGTLNIFFNFAQTNGDPSSPPYLVVPKNSLSVTILASFVLWPKDSFLTISFSLDFSESYITQSFEESSDSGINFITNDFGLIARLGNFGTADTHFQNVSIFWTFSGNSATAKVYFFSYNTASYITANTYTYNSNYLLQFATQGPTASTSSSPFNNTISVVKNNNAIVIVIILLLAFFCLMLLGFVLLYYGSTKKSHSRQRSGSEENVY